MHATQPNERNRSGAALLTAPKRGRDGPMADLRPPTPLRSPHSLAALLNDVGLLATWTAVSTGGNRGTSTIVNVDPVSTAMRLLFCRHLSRRRVFQHSAAVLGAVS